MASTGERSTAVDRGGAHGQSRMVAFGARRVRRSKWAMDSTRIKPEVGRTGDATVAVHEASTEHDARDVASLLAAAGIPADVEPAISSSGPVSTWVIVPWERQQEADAVLKRLEVPVLPRFAQGGLEAVRALEGRPVVTWAPASQDTATTSTHWNDPEESEETEHRVELPDSGPVLPRAILALSAIGFGAGLQRAIDALFGPRGAIQAFAASPDRLGEAWRYVTSGFMHFGIPHYLSNGAFGLLMGVVLFGTHGAGAAMMAWLVASVVGVGAEVVFSPQAAWIAGASAGNYGLVGLWAKGQVDRSRVDVLPTRERLRTMGVLLLLLPGALTPVTSSGSRVAVMAHAAGFVAGFLCGYVFERRVSPEDLSRIDRRSNLAQWVAIALVTGAFSWAALALSGGF